jgi:hypothetical protein
MYIYLYVNQMPASFGHVHRRSFEGVGAAPKVINPKMESQKSYKDSPWMKVKFFSRITNFFFCLANH